MEYHWYAHQSLQYTSSRHDPDSLLEAMALLELAVQQERRADSERESLTLV